MAAQALVRHSYAHPVETYATNVMGCVHLFEAVRATPSVKVIVNVTSDKCYENREWVWGYRESDPVGGYDPYSSSKGCAELVTAAYRSSYFNPLGYSEHGVAVATGRAGNVIGGGDWAADRLVPDLVRAIGRDEAVTIRNPDAVRPWQHVFEPVGGYLVLAEQLYREGPAYAEAWNFGPEDESVRDVKSVVSTFTTLWGKGARWEADVQRQHVHEATFLKLDCSKARARLGWQPRWRLESALEATAAWYKAHAAGRDMNAYSLAQLSDYAAAPAHDYRT
jgi:CDP-glucose 4,6-dehydratase